MTKKTRKKAIAEPPEPPQTFATASKEEKLTFLDFYMKGLCASGEISPEQLQAATEQSADEREGMADQVIATSRAWFEAFMPGKIRNLKDLQDVMEIGQSLTESMKGAGIDSDEGVELVDFTSDPLTKKIEFVEALRGTSWFSHLEQAQDDAPKLDEDIRRLAQRSRDYGQHPKTLEELAAVLRKIEKLEDSPVLEQAFKNSFAPLAEQLKDLPMEEVERLTREAAEKNRPEWRKNLHEAVSNLDQQLDETDDPATAGKALGSFMVRGIQQAQSGFERHFQEEIVLKLDEIQRQLNQLLGMQEKLEKIQDQFGEVPPLPTIDTTSPSKKEYTEERERITPTVDRVLFELFNEERKARGVTVSRMQDIILWQRYDKPKLSYEIKVDESPLPESKETGATHGAQKTARPSKKQK